MRRSRGDIEVIILVVIIIGAFLLAGGQYMMSALPWYDNIDNSANNNDSDAGVGDGESASTDWRINVITSTCDNVLHKANVRIELNGTQKGTYDVSVQNGGTYIKKFSGDFTTIPLHGKYLELYNSDGFDKNKWKIDLYETGSTTPKTTKEMNPTNCT